jgi:sulfite exporter TauE/SafE
MHEIILLLSASVPVILGLGFFLGVKHAVEADHLAAVTTIVQRHNSVLHSAFIGGLWGLGHTISLFAAGILVLLLDFQISERTERALEFCVGLMLTVLGINVFRRLLNGGKLHFHRHEHGSFTHVHPHIHEPSEVGELDIHHHSTISPRPVVVGMIHGMAGSAALMLVVIPTIDSRVIGLLYILVFGIGSIGGMMLMSLLVSLPFRLTSSRFERANQALQLIAGIISVTLGLWIVYEKGFSEKLFG